MASFDVVVPCYNYARFLPGCLRSVLDQHSVSVRVLVIDDCSTDDTPQVAQALAAADPRVTFVRHEANKGHIRTYNEGLLEWAAADYTILLSADDLLAEGALSTAAHVLEADSSLAMACGFAALFSDEQNLTAARECHLADNNPIRSVALDTRQFLEMCTFGNPVATPTAIVRTSVQRAVGGYDPRFPHTADLHMWMRIALHGHIAVLDKTLAYKRTHAASMGVTYTHSGHRDLTERWRVFEAMFDGTDSAIEAAGLGPNVVRSRVAAEAYWVASALARNGCFDDAHSALKFGKALTAPTLIHRDYLRARIGILGHRLANAVGWSLSAPRADSSLVNSGPKRIGWFPAHGTDLANPPWSA